MVDKRITERNLEGIHNPLHDAWMNLGNTDPDSVAAYDRSITAAASDVAAQRARFEQTYYRDTQAAYPVGQMNVQAAARATHIPEIDPPSQHTVVDHKKVAQELDELHQVKNIFADHMILCLIFVHLQTQRTHREEAVLNSHQRISHEQKFQKLKQGEEFQLHREMDESASALAKTQTAGTVLAIANVLTIVGGIFAAVFTAGAAIPAVMGALGAVSAAGTGVNTAMQTHYKAENDRQTGALERTKYDRRVSHDSVKKTLAHNKTEMNQFNSLNALQKDVQKNSYRNTRFDPNAAAAEA